MSIREEQCNKVCRILDDVLANRPTERDSLIVAVRKAFEQLGNSEQLPSAQPEPKEGHWILHESPDGGEQYECSRCGVLWEFNDGTPEDNEAYFCPKCGAKMTISTK